MAGHVGANVGLVRMIQSVKKMNNLSIFMVFP